MSWLEALHFLPKAPDPRPAREIEGDILAELQFHLDMKTRDLEAAGMNPEQARQTAQEKFGDLDRVFQRCRRAQLGERIMMQRILFVMMIVLIGAVAFLGVQAHEASASNRETAAALARIDKRLEKFGDGKGDATPSVPREMRGSTGDVSEVTFDVEGHVLDEEGRPLMGADVLLIVKTWANEDFRQEDLATKTDGVGRFLFKQPCLPFLQAAFNITALADGYAMESVYLEKGDTSKIQPQTLRLKKGIARKIRCIRKNKGIGEEKLWVYPSERLALDGSRHLLYSQGSERIWRRIQMDEENWDGEISVSWFLPGEKGTVYVGFGPDQMKPYLLSPEDTEIYLKR